MMKGHPVILSIIQIAALCFFASICLPAEEIVQSTWTASPPQIDGQNQDWTGEAVTSEKGAGVDYAFRNDGRDLYILLIFKDPKFLSSIDKTGVTVFASTSGKKDKDMGVLFVKKTVSGAQLIEYMEKMGQPLAEERKLQLKDAPQVVLYTGTAVNKKGEPVFPSGQVQDIDLPGFRYGQQEKTIIYEFRIPLVSREVHPAGIGAEPGKNIKIGFEWGGLTKEMKEAMRGQARGTTIGADANRDEQTTGSNILDSPLSTGPSGPKKYSFWTDVKLAQAQ
jgi:hypothetical protein